MKVDELCQWLKPKLDDEDWNDVEKIIRNQRIKGKNFLNCPEAKWEAFGLQWGVANSLFQIAQGVLRDGAQTQEIKGKSIVQRISEAGAPAAGYSLLSTLIKSLMKECETHPIAKSNDGKLLAVCCSDFLINEEMTEGFQQYFFLRDEAKREMDFCEKFLMNEYPRAAVLGGSPGTGKSLTLFTWAWLKSFTADETFVFITFLGSPKSFPLEFRFGYLQKGVFNYFSSIFPFYNALDVEDLKSFILYLKLENAVLVLDGLTNISFQLHTRFKSDFQRMFFVTSQQVFLGDADKSITHQSFTCFPWKLEDYKQVCIYDLFWGKLDRDVFNPTSMKEESAVNHRRELIHRKFFYAGYSARWMFRVAESELPKLVEAYASKVKDVPKYLFATSWDKTDDAVNHILVQMDELGCCVLVSVHAAKILALISRDSSEIAHFIRKSATAVKDARMMGLAYEVHIRSLLKKSIGSSLKVSDKGTNEHLWVVNFVSYYESLEDIKLPGGRLSPGDWYFPCSFMQGGFDMFQILAANGGYKVRFIQVTIAKTHSVKYDYFADVLSALRKVVPIEFLLVEVEVVGLVPEYRLQEFKFSPIVPIELGQKILQTILHCTIPNDGYWLRNPNL